MDEQPSMAVWIAGGLGMVSGWIGSGYVAAQIASGHHGLIWWIVFLAVWSFMGSIAGWVFIYPPVMIVAAIESAFRRNKS